MSECGRGRQMAQIIGGVAGLQCGTAAEGPPVADRVLEAGEEPVGQRAGLEPLAVLAPVNRPPDPEPLGDAELPGIPEPDVVTVHLLLTPVYSGDRCMSRPFAIQWLTCESGTVARSKILLRTPAAMTKAWRSPKTLAVPAATLITLVTRFFITLIRQLRLWWLLSLRRLCRRCPQQLPCFSFLESGKF